MVKGAWRATDMTERLIYTHAEEETEILLNKI